MALEKVVKAAKIINTNKGLYIGIVGIGMAIAGAGYTDENDTALLGVGSVIAVLTTWGAVRELKDYQVVATYCRQYGFTEDIMLYDNLRDKAEIFAQEANKIEKFEEAWKRYRIYF